MGDVDSFKRLCTKLVYEKMKIEGFEKGRATGVGFPANGRTEAESECRRAPEGTARKPWIDHTRRGGEEPGDCGGKTQPGVSHFPCLGNGHRKRKIHSQHLQAPNAQRYLQSKIHGTDFILRSAGWRVKPLSHVNRCSQNASVGHRVRSGDREWVIADAV